MEPGHHAANPHGAVAFFATIALIVSVISLVLWVLALVMSKGQGLSFKSSLLKALKQLKATVIKYPIFFALVVIATIGYQFAVQLQFAPGVNESGTTATTSMKMLGQLMAGVLALAQLLCYVICQSFTYKTNSAFYRSDPANAGMDNIAICYRVILLQSFLFLLGVIMMLFLCVPAVLFNVFMFVAGPASVVESKSFGAVTSSAALVKSKFWSVTKFAMPLLLLTQVGDPALYAFHVACKDPLILPVVACIIKLYNFAAAALTWQCQTIMYDFLKEQKVSSQPV